MTDTQTSITIALDAMGGDLAPSSVIEGAEHALKHTSNVSFILFGDKDAIEAELLKAQRLKAASRIVHCTEIIENEDKLSTVLRNKKDASMRRAIQSVANGEAQAIISSGSTGALMALARLILKTAEGVDRPAIATLVPTRKDPAVLLDMGANIDCSADHLIQFSLLGAIFSRLLTGKAKPNVGLLNIGIEQQKGGEVLREASELLESSNLPGTYVGFVEADQLLVGDVDVIVTDGFTGNVALKSIEGTARFIYWGIMDAMKRSFMTKLFTSISALFMKSTLSRFDPRLYNGAMFLGLKGICVKSHGSSDHKGFCSAIENAIHLVRGNFAQAVTSELEALKAQTRSPTQHLE